VIRVSDPTDTLFSSKADFESQLNNTILNVIEHPDSFWTGNNEPNTSHSSNALLGQLYGHGVIDAGAAMTLLHTGQFFHVTLNSSNAINTSIKDSIIGTFKVSTIDEDRLNMAADSFLVPPFSELAAVGIDSIEESNIGDGTQDYVGRAFLYEFEFSVNLFRSYILAGDTLLAWGRGIGSEGLHAPLISNRSNDSLDAHLFPDAVPTFTPAGRRTILDLPWCEVSAVNFNTIPMTISVRTWLHRIEVNGTLRWFSSSPNNVNLALTFVVSPPLPIPIPNEILSLAKQRRNNIRSVLPK